MLNSAVWGAPLRSVFAYSPFLTGCAVSEPDLLVELEDLGPQATMDGICAQFSGLETAERTPIMAEMRALRRRAALALALADLGGHFTLDHVTAYLSRLADASVRTAIGFALRDAARRGDIDLPAGDEPAAGSGIIILGMGKLGADELNYSSDIDLIVLFEEDALRVTGREPLLGVATRLIRTLTYLLEQKTQAGYVFRTDLRLRPHLPGHPLALSSTDAELYYERFGQNWERAALIKARSIAGDHNAASAFLAQLRPFIWRKHLDFAAIRDIHSIKRQINAHRGHSRIGVAGHDVKVGRGGIREIEFFVQTQQLILGGRHPELRAPRTVDALRALANGRWIAEEVERDLAAAYHDLRMVEHRLQMVADKQTQTIPSGGDELARFARFAGHPSAASFETWLLDRLRCVEKHYAALFEDERDLGAGAHLVFTGTEDDPPTLETLREMGFTDPAKVAGRIREWHHGHVRATRSTRARELLTELVPGLLEALRRQTDPDEAFALFDRFLTQLPAGVQLFSLMRAHAQLLTLLPDLMGAAPRLADLLASQTDLFDAMLAPDFMEPLPGETRLREELNRVLSDAQSYETLLDIVRRWARGRKFQAGLHILLGISPAREASAMLSTMADILLQRLLEATEQEYARLHGRIGGGRFAVLALGKLGSQELTIGSDLDLVFLFDADPEARSNGERSLPAPTYYARFCQRLVSAVSAQTAEGQLYEIDMRLRPSGNAGPVACAVESFRSYHARTAATWEQQALCRARVIGGDADLAVDIDEIVRTSLLRPRDPAGLRQDIAAMRERIFKEHGSDDPWQIKHVRGGIVDVEFILQYLCLAHATDDPDWLDCPMLEIAELAADGGYLSVSDARLIVLAEGFYQAVQAVLRLGGERTFKAEAAPMLQREALLKSVQRQCDFGRPVTDFPALERCLIETQTAVRHLFGKLIETPQDS